MNPITLTSAFVLDIFIGDPTWLPHPVRWMGRGIAGLENLLRRGIRAGQCEKAAGIALSLMVVLGTFGGTLLLIALGERLHPFVALSLILYFSFSCLATKSLGDAARAVQAAVVRATVETVSDTHSFLRRKALKWRERFQEIPAMLFRDAVEDDYSAVCALVPTREELFWVYPRGAHPLTVDQVKHLSTVRKSLTVALEDGEVISFANLFNFNARCAFVGNLVIAAACRGRGFGRQLLAHMVETAFSQYGLAEVHISVFSDNVPALLLYAKHGFQPYAVEAMRDYRDRNVALIHLKLE